MFVWSVQPYTSIIHEIKSKVKCLYFIYLQFVTKVLYNISYRLYNIFPISYAIYYINSVTLYY